jgi:hypothetical protein
MVARATNTPTRRPRASSRRQASRFGLAPAVAFNFGSGHGWSYVSAGIGAFAMVLRPEVDRTCGPLMRVLTDLNYGGGARWFIKPHLAFSFDVRVYRSSLEARSGRTGQPRARVLTYSAPAFPLK